MVFIFPHTLVRVVSFSLIAAFMKYYTVTPATILIITNSIIALDVARRNTEDKSNAVLFGTIAAGFCAPFCVEPTYLSHRRYLRRSLLSTNILILISLLFLLCFPFIIPPHLIPPHINFESKVTGPSPKWKNFREI